MRLFSLLLFICSQLLYSQSASQHRAVNLLIEDETQQGFFLGVNGFLQNTEKETAFAITQLDTIPYRLHIDSDTFHFEKNIHLREKSTHRYVLTKNFHGELKLRYRGTSNAIPHHINSQAYDRSVVWPEHFGNKIPVEAPEEVASTSEVAAADAVVSPKEDKDSVQVIEIEPVNPPNEQNDVLLPSKDTLNEHQRKVVVSEPRFDHQSFKDFISELKQTEFEFEKLTKSKGYLQKHGISSKELKQIFEVLKYDQTRLQVLKDAQEKIIDPQNLQILKAALEYEISKKEFDNLIPNE